MTRHPDPLPDVALAVIWGETLALLRWNLAAYLADAMADDPTELEEVREAIASVDAAAAERGAGPWNETACAWIPDIDDAGPLSADSIRGAAPVRAWDIPERIAGLRADGLHIFPDGSPDRPRWKVVQATGDGVSVSIGDAASELEAIALAEGTPL